jgi:hypothetical protein
MYVHSNCVFIDQDKNYRAASRVHQIHHLVTIKVPAKADEQDPKSVDGSIHAGIRAVQHCLMSSLVSRQS